MIQQSFTDFEYIVIDGNSNDQSVENIKKYQDRITYWTSEPDNGIYQAMNKGISRATGDYCLFLNSGDYLINNDVLAFCLLYLEKGTPLIIGRIIHGNGETSPRIVEKISFLYFIEKYSICHQAVFIRRELFLKYGGYSEDYKIISDWIFFYNAIINNDVLYDIIDMIIVFYEGGGISSNSDIILYERERYLKAILPLPLLQDIKSLSQSKFLDLFFYYPGLLVDFGSSVAIKKRLEISRIFNPIIFLFRPFRRTIRRIRKLVFKKR